jgi:hypothetical protein
MTDHLLLGGYILTAPTSLPALPQVPDPFLTISHCLMDDFPQDEFNYWYTDRAEAEAAMAGSAASHLIAVGLLSTDAQAVIEQMAFKPEYAALTWPLLMRATPMPADATVLGHELVGFEEIHLHSWHCHDYLPDARRLLGIEINQLGLIDSRAEAQTVLDWIKRLPLEEAPEEVPWVVATLARVT